MKTICFFIGNLNLSGGTERVSTIIANELSVQNYRIIFISLYDGEKPFFSINKNIEFYSLFAKKTSFWKNYITAIFRLRKLIKQYKIDTLISVESLISIFSIPATLCLKVKLICWEHFNFTVDLGVKLRQVSRYMAALFCDYVVTLTETDKDIWTHKTIHLAKIISIHNPSSFTKTTHAPKFSNKTVITVGRYNYQKGFDLLVNAWAIAINSAKDWKLRIIGDGDEKEKIFSLIKEKKVEDSIELISNTKQISTYYQTATFYCMSSRFEGLPMVLLEAQSYNLPIISFNFQTGPKELIEDTKDGILVPAENIELLADAMVYLMNNPVVYEKMVKHLLLKEDKSFSIEYIINQWKTIL